MLISKKARSDSSGMYDLIILGFFAALFGIYLFYYGFLLTRSELTNVTEVPHKKPPEFQRIVMLLVDGLCAGLLPPIDRTLRMPFFRSLLDINIPRRHFLAHFIADPPTTTLQRLKALLTGSMPTFIDASNNFGGSELQEDNIIKQWVLAGRKICFVGDQVWTELLSGAFVESFPLPAFNIKDLDTVDSAVKAFIFREMKRDKCDVLIGHMLGIDHCGHTFGRSHPEMDRKLAELDDFLSRLLPKLRSSDILIVFGDHGMTATGDHGGDSEAEVDAAFFAYSPRGFPHAPFTGTGFGGVLEAPLPIVEQVNLVPTLAALTGTSIPFSNLGVVLTELLSFDTVSPVNDNFKQMYAYAKEYQNHFGLIKIPEEMEQRIKQNSDQPCSSTPSSLEECLSLMRTLRGIFRIHWTRMDTWRIALGFTFTLLALLAFLNFDMDGSCRPGMSCFIAFTTSVLLSFVSFTPFAFIPLSVPFYRLGVHWVKRTIQIANWETTIAAVILAIVTLTASSNSFVVQEARVLSFLLQTMLILTCICTFGSTSKRRWYILSPLILCIFLLWTGRFLEVCREESPTTSLCIPLGGTNGDIYGTKNSNLMAALLTRLSALSGEKLRQVAGARLILAATGVIIALFTHRCLLSMWGNDLLGEGVIGILLIVTTRIGSILLPLIWLLDVLIAVSHGGSDLLRRFELLQPHFLSTIRINLARAVFALGGVLFASLNYRPLLLIAGIGNGEDGRGKGMYLSGFATVYTSWILTTFVVAPFLPFLVLLGDVYVWPYLGLLFCAIAPPLYLLQRPRASTSKKAKTGDQDLQAKVLWLLECSSRWPPVIYACILGELGFYCLGHQPTFPAIPWEAAFSVTAGEGVDSATLLSAVLVLAHTFASQIIVTAALPLLVLLPLHFASDEGKNAKTFLLVHSETCSTVLRTAFDRLFRRYLIAHFTLFIGHLLCAFILRRHLMVWKIFAPRLIFSFCGLGVVCVTTLLVHSLLIHRLHAAVVKLRQHILSNRTLT